MSPGRMAAVGQSGILGVALSIYLLALLLGIGRLLAAAGLRLLPLLILLLPFLILPAIG